MGCGGRKWLRWACRRRLWQEWLLLWGGCLFARSQPVPMPVRLPLPVSA